MNQLVDNILQSQSVTSPYDTKNCPHCGKEIKPFEQDLSFLGKGKRWILPACKCEQDAMLAEVEKANKFQEERKVRELFSISDVGDRYLQATFNDFIPRQGTETATRIIKHYIANFEDFGRESVLLWGAPGNGKTHLAAIVHNEIRAQGKVVVFVSMPDLLGKIKSTFNKSNKESEEQILKALNICDLLIIDDLGAEKTSDWVEEVIFKIIDNRYRRNKPILATSNVSPDKLGDKIGFRSYDRIVEMMQPIENKASSYRQEVAQGRVSKFQAILQGGQG